MTELGPDPLYSSESMLNRNSEATFNSHNNEGFQVTKTDYDQSTNSLEISYIGTRVITNKEEISFSITEFKNPVNMNPKIGFRITTQDSAGYMVDQSVPDLVLDTPMTIVGNLVGKELSLLGDSNGQNIGRIYEYNKLQFFLSSYIPFEQYCYFTFKFPPNLKIDDALQSLTGEGVFAPLSGTVLPSNMWSVDYTNNIIYVEGCRNVDYIKT